MYRVIRLASLVSVLSAAALAPAAPATPAVAPTFSVPERELPDPLVMIAYGDMRFTDPGETTASQPQVRQALVARVAAEHPAAVFLNGDLPWHGKPADYAVFQAETASWRDAHLRIYPALGNHEFSGCEETRCLEYWWNTFPELRGRRWYSVALGTQVLAVALDSDASLLAGSEQRQWLEAQIAALPRTVRLVVIFLHHPPVADPQGGKLADHNARPNEVALADYLGKTAPHSHARFFVSAGHTHNYERFSQDGVVYLVSGGGGAHPYPVERGPDDLYQGSDFPNYHYVRMELHGRRLDAQMVRYDELTPTAPWTVRDRFELDLDP